MPRPALLAYFLVVAGCVVWLGMQLVRMMLAEAQAAVRALLKRGIEVKDITAIGHMVTTIAPAEARRFSQ